MPIVTQQPITVSYFIQDIASARATYNRMQWFRSRDGADGPYEAAAASSSSGAVLLGALQEPHALNGKTLSFMVNGVTQVDVVFAGADPYTTAQAIIDIAAETALVTGADVDGALQLTTALTGSGGSIEILESDGAVALGFQTGQAAVGVDVDTALVSNTHEYFYTDQNSDSTFWYKVQLYHSTTAARSNFSVPLPAVAVPVLPASKTIIAFARLVDMTGRPLVGRKIILSNTYLPNTIGDYNIFRQHEVLVTDVAGYAEVRLLRGMELDVHVEGSTYTRRITLPDEDSTDTQVNLFDTALSTEDEFGIQVPNVNYPIRTS